MTAKISDNDIEKIISHWVKSSDDDYQTMESLLKSGSYSWALFLGHIVIEKLLKAVYIKKKHEHAPLTHNLYRLAELSSLDISSEQSDWLDTITSFNINARYDDYKREFYLSCTESYSKEWIDKIKELKVWIKKEL